MLSVINSVGSKLPAAVLAVRPMIHTHNEIRRWRYTLGTASRAAAEVAIIGSHTGKSPSPGVFAGETPPLA